jgi:histidine triad (HIT) family protein
MHGRTGRVLAFRDINPQAPTHVLVISKTHYPDVAALAAADHALLGGRSLTWPPG